jgi:LPS export ABC transporter protein LptC
MIRDLNKTGWLFLAVLIITAALTTWLRSRPLPTDLPAGGEAIPQIDFFLEEFRIRQYGQNGSVEYTLAGERLDHNMDTKKSEIRNPRITLAPTDASHWTVRAARAVIAAPEADEVVLEQEVLLEKNFSRAAQAGAQTELQIYAESLLLKPAADYIQTDKPVTIISQQNRIDADALQIDLHTGIHTLQRARGHYVP